MKSLPISLRNVPLWKVIVQAAFEQYNKNANLSDFLKTHPTPTDLLDAEYSDLVKMFHKYFFYRRVLKKLKATAHVWYDDWKDLRELPCMNFFITKKVIEYLEHRI